MHHTAPFSLPPASLFLLILCHLLPSSFSAICLHTVCASRKFPLRLWGELRFSLLRSSLVLLLYVFHAGKASSSCMQQGVCSVCGCPIRDPTVWCYNLPFQKDPLSIFLSLWLLFSLFLYKTFMPLFFFPVSDSFTLFSSTYFLNLFIWLLALCHFPPYMHSLSLSLFLPPPTLRHLKWLIFPVYFSVFLYSFLASADLVSQKSSNPRHFAKKHTKKEFKFTINWGLQWKSFECLVARLDRPPCSLQSRAQFLRGIFKYDTFWGSFASNGTVCEAWSPVNSGAPRRHKPPSASILNKASVFSLQGGGCCVCAAVQPTGEPTDQGPPPYG